MDCVNDRLTLGFLPEGGGHTSSWVLLRRALLSNYAHHSAWVANASPPYSGMSFRNNMLTPRRRSTRYFGPSPIPSPDATLRSNVASPDTKILGDMARSDSHCPRPRLLCVPSFSPRDSASGRNARTRESPRAGETDYIGCSGASVATSVAPLTGPIVTSISCNFFTVWCLCCTICYFSVWLSSNHERHPFFLFGPRPSSVESHHVVHLPLVRLLHSVS